MSLFDRGGIYEGRVHVHHASQSDEVRIGCTYDDFFFSHFECLRGRVDGGTIFARGNSPDHQNPWCPAYALSHTITWTFEATVESDRVIRGLLTGVFTYVGGGSTVELERGWRVVLSR